VLANGLQIYRDKY